MNADDVSTSRSPNQFGRRILLGGGMGVLASCGMVQKSPFFSTLATFRTSPEKAIDRRKVDSIPYASLLAWFDGDTRALLVLGEYKPDERLVWYSADHQAMTTWGPLVLGLAGLDVSLASTTLSGRWSKDVRSLDGHRLQKTLEFQAPTNRMSVSVESVFSTGGLETVKILDTVKTLRRVREHAKANRWHTYTNDYWVDDATGQWWRTRQLVVPTMRPLNLILTKPPLHG